MVSFISDGMHKTIIKCIETFALTCVLYVPLLVLIAEETYRKTRVIPVYYFSKHIYGIEIYVNL